MCSALCILILALSWLIFWRPGSHSRPHAVRGMWSDGRSCAPYGVCGYHRQLAHRDKHLATRPPILKTCNRLVTTTDFRFPRMRVARKQLRDDSDIRSSLLVSASCGNNDRSRFGLPNRALTVGDPAAMEPQWNADWQVNARNRFAREILRCKNHQVRPTSTKIVSIGHDHSLRLRRR